jgi:uncharacterized protein with HEPN domain/predicted nucleotidyltransferase
MNSPVSTKREIVKRLKAQRVAIRNVGVRKLGLFGSFLKNSPRVDSDVDLLVEFHPSRKSFDNYWILLELLERELNRPVDLLTIESLRPTFRLQILDEVEYVTLISDLLCHMLDEVEYLLAQRALITKSKLLADDTLKRAFSRSIEIIGEAVKQMPAEFRQSHPDVPWKLISGMRDLLVHKYFAVDYYIVWDVIEHKLDDLNQMLISMLTECD